MKDVAGGTRGHVDCPDQWPGLILSSSTTTPNEWALVLLCHHSNANTSDDDRGIVQLFCIVTGRTPNVENSRTSNVTKLHQLDLDGLPFVGAYLEDGNALYRYGKPRPSLAVKL